MANSGTIKDGVVDLQKMYSEDGQDPPRTPIEVCLNGWGYRTDPGTVPNSGSTCALVGDGWGDRRTKHTDRVRISNVCPPSDIENPQNRGTVPPPPHGVSAPYSLR